MTLVKPPVGTDKLTVLQNIVDAEGLWAYRLEALQIGTKGTVLQSIGLESGSDGGTRITTALLWLPSILVVEDTVNGGYTLE